MFDRHFWGILNAIVTGADNGAERINGVIEELKIINRGYRNKQISELRYCFFM